MNKKKKIIMTLFLVVIAAAVALCCININDGDYLPLGDKYDNKVHITVPEKYDEYYKKNNDFVGWIKIDGTTIDYPVVQSDDNDYVFNYTYPNMCDDNFEKYSEELNKRTLFNTNIDYNENDQFLTLSTCTREVDKNGQRADCRIAIVARMLRPNENEFVDTSLATINENPKYPQIWYTNNNIDNPYINDEKWYPYEIIL